MIKPKTKEVTSMATTKKNDRPKHCGFEAPAIGRAVPKDWVKVTRKDGTVTFVPPEKAKKTAAKKK